MFAALDLAIFIIADTGTVAANAVGKIRVGGIAVLSGVTGALASRIAARGFTAAARAVIPAGPASAGASQAGATIGFGLILTTAARTRRRGRSGANAGGAGRAGRTNGGRRSADTLMRRFIADFAVVNTRLAADRAKITAGILVDAGGNRLAVLLCYHIFNIEFIGTAGVGYKNIFTGTLVRSAKSVLRISQIVVRGARRSASSMIFVHAFVGQAAGINASAARTAALRFTGSVIAFDSGGLRSATAAKKRTSAGNVRTKAADGASAGGVAVFLAAAAARRYWSA
jgi:hypothetical protein